MKNKIREILKNHISNCIRSDIVYDEKITEQQIINLMLEQVPEKKVCESCGGGKRITDMLGEEIDCPRCVLVYQWNQCREQMIENINKLKG